MERMQINDIKGKILTIRIRPSEPSCQEGDLKLVPYRFIRVIPETREVNKKACVAYYKEEKKVVPGTEISVGTTLTIR